MRLIDADNLRGRVCEIFLCAEPGSAEERRLALVLGLIDSEHTITPPPNDPLTLEELREMDGEPVYDGLGFQWFVIDSVDDIDELFTEITMTDGTVFDTDEDGVDRTLERFYRRKPEEGTE